MRSPFSREAQSYVTQLCYFETQFVDTGWSSDTPKQWHIRIGYWYFTDTLRYVSTKYRN